MYITENQRVGESVLFLLSARNSLANTVIESLLFWLRGAGLYFFLASSKADSRFMYFW